MAVTYSQLPNKVVKAEAFLSDPGQGGSAQIS
jgi:hypothetical protein